MTLASTSPIGAGPPSRPRGRLWSDALRQARLLLLVPAAALAFLVGEMVYLVVINLEPDATRDDLFAALPYSLGVLAWNGLVPAAMAGFVLVAARFWPLGRPVVVSTCALLTAVLVFALISMNVDDSSTAVLLLLFLPVYLLLALLPFVGLTALVHRLRRRGARRKD